MLPPPRTADVHGEADSSPPLPLAPSIHGAPGRSGRDEAPRTNASASALPPNHAQTASLPRPFDEPAVDGSGSELPSFEADGLNLHSRVGRQSSDSSVRRGGGAVDSEALVMPSQPSKANADPDPPKSLPPMGERLGSRGGPLHGLRTLRTPTRKPCTSRFRGSRKQAGAVGVPGGAAAGRRRTWGWGQVEPASIRARASFGSRAMTAMVIQQSTWGFVVWRSKTQRYPAGSPELDSR
jgi:hypothetical protein